MVSAIDNKKEQKATSNSSTSKTNDVGAFFKSISYVFDNDYLYIYIW